MRRALRASAGGAFEGGGGELVPARGEGGGCERSAGGRPATLSVQHRGAKKPQRLGKLGILRLELLELALVRANEPSLVDEW